MEFLNFDEVADDLPSLNLDDPLRSLDDGRDELEARAELEAQRVDVPNPFYNTGAYGTTIRLKLINNKEVEAVLWDHNDGTNYPMFRAKDACSLCAKMGLDCFLASRGALVTGCTCCISLFRECSFTHDEIPQGYVPTFAGIAEDSQVDQGAMQLIQPPMKSSGQAKARKTGARFPREAVKLLRQWLAEHADHPYPNEREKDELKHLTGLKRSQIANWLANARRRGKVRPSPGPASPTLGAVDVPAPLHDPLAELGPLDRWKMSPPEHEPALMTDIARNIADQPVGTAARKSSNPSLRNRSRASSRKASSDGEDSAWSVFQAPTESSFETRASSNSDLSLVSSSRSQLSRASLASSSRDRRRRRRAPMTQRVVAQATKAKGARHFQCTFCTDTFATKYDWQRHEKSLHLALERWICCPTGGTIELVPGPPRCAFCPQPNPSADHLETHNYVACQEKTVQERTYYRKDHLRQHLRLTHECKFDPAMDGWKSTTTEITSRCGFCPARFTSWHVRADHLAAHFRHGADMSMWSGDWGFDAAVEKHVENAIPPYLIGLERNTMNPWIARPLTSPPAGAADASDSAGGSTPGLTRADSPADCNLHWPNQFLRDQNCWFRVQEELTKYVAEHRSCDVTPTDRQLQDRARTVIYGDPDPLDWTAADNPTWLAAFKYQVGIGPCPADINLQATCTVPMVAPYAVKGGLRSTGPKKTSAGERGGGHPEARGHGTTPQTPRDPNLDGARPGDVVDPPMDLDLDLDLDALNFDGVDFDGMGKLGLTDPCDLTLTTVLDTSPSSEAPMQSGPDLFGPFDLGGPRGFDTTALPDFRGLSEQDLYQLTGYTAGFH